jgi:hypothetical protein
LAGCLRIQTEQREQLIFAIGCANWEFPIIAPIITGTIAWWLAAIAVSGGSRKKRSEFEELVEQKGFEPSTPTLRT